MSFGYSLTDFVTVVQLSWRVYRGCKDAPNSFGDIAAEVLSLHAVLKEAEETIFTHKLSPERQKNLKNVADGCYRVLKDLQDLISKYERLGSNSKTTWDRMKWAAEDVTNLRFRLTSNVTLLTAFVSMLPATVHRKLENYWRDLEEREDHNSVISTQSLESLSLADRQSWDLIRKELQQAGITVDVFEANKEYIFEWLVDKVSTMQEEVCDSGSSDSNQERRDYVGGDHRPMSAAQPASSYPEDEPSSAVSPPRSAAMTPVTPTVNRPTPDTVASAPTVPTFKLVIDDRHKPLTHRDLAKSSAIRRLAVAVGILNPRRQLVAAARAGNSHVLRRIFGNASEARLVDAESFNTALAKAVMHFRYQAIQTLLDNRNDTAIDWNFALRYLSWDYDTEDRLSSLLAVLDGHIPDEYRVRVFIAACIRGRLKIVNLLLQRNIDPNVQWLESSGLEAPLQAASRRGHLEIAQALVECGAELDMYFEGSCDSPLYAASGQGHLNIVQYLVRVGANVNMEGGNDGTALQAASAAGHLEIARYLLGNGADLAVTGGTSRDALQLAAEGPHLDMVELLVSSGARVKPRSARDLLSKACRHGHPGLAKLLLIRGLVPDLNSDDLQTAASFGHLEIVKILLENGADPNRPGDQYGSPLMMTEDEKYPEVRQLLLEYGAVPGIW